VRSFVEAKVYILTFGQVFYFIKPTPANLAAYERWSGTELQSSWLGDMVDEVTKITLTAGNTMIIPRYALTFFDTVLGIDPSVSSYPKVDGYMRYTHLLIP
jgi:hypothetical protein